MNFLAAGTKGCKKYILVLFSPRVLDMQTRKWPYFDTNGVPEAENLGVRGLFGDLSFGGGLDPKVNVSGPKKVQKCMVPATSPPAQATFGAWMARRPSS